MSVLPAGLIPRLTALLERGPRLMALLLGGMFLAALGAELAIGRGQFREDPLIFEIAGFDPISYYAWTRSALVGGDLDFEDEYARLGAPDNPMNAPVEATGRRGNVFAVGLPVAAAPGFALAHLVAPLVGAPRDGYSAPYVVAWYATVTLGCWLGCALLWHTLVGLYGKRGEATLLTLATLLSGSLVFYSLSSMSHTVSMAAVTALLGLQLSSRPIGDRPPALPRLAARPLLRWALLGALLGAATLARWQNALFGMALLVELPTLLRTQRGRGMAALALGAVCGALVFSPQLIGWQAVYGTPLTMPQGRGFLTLSQPRLGLLLFSSNHGWISWTPMVALCLWGLMRFTRRQPWLGGALLLTVAAQVWINASVWDWWAGWSFGQRRLLNCTLPLGLGLAELWHSSPRARRRWGTGLLLLLTGWNLVFAARVRLGLLSREGTLTLHEWVGDTLHPRTSWRRRGLVRQAEDARAAGQLPRAGRLLDEALALDPEHRDVLEGHIALARARGQEEEARRWQARLEALLLP